MEHSARERRLDELRNAISRKSKACWVRAWTDMTVTNVGGLLIAATAGAALLFIIAYRSGFPLISGVLGFVLGTCAWLPVMRLPSLRELQECLSNLHYELEIETNHRSEWDSRLRQSEELLRRSEAAVDSALHTVKKAEADLRQAENARDTLVNQNRRLDLLSSRDWTSMSGRQFEDFLKELFEARGYSVLMTKASGDYGGDLIISRTDAKICVQAKRWTNAVGTAAIQEAHTAMTHYRCDVAAVVTTATFTRQARELALSVRCKLIDGSQLIQLIDGRVKL